MYTKAKTFQYRIVFATSNYQFNFILFYNSNAIHILLEIDEHKMKNKVLNDFNEDHIFILKPNFRTLCKIKLLYSGLSEAAQRK